MIICSEVDQGEKPREHVPNPSPVWQNYTTFYNFERLQAMQSLPLAFFERSHPKELPVQADIMACIHISANSCLYVVRISPYSKTTEIKNCLHTFFLLEKHWDYGKKLKWKKQIQSGPEEKEESTQGPYTPPVFRGIVFYWVKASELQAMEIII